MCDRLCTFGREKVGGPVAPLSVFFRFHVPFDLVRSVLTRGDRRVQRLSSAPCFTVSRFVPRLRRYIDAAARCGGGVGVVAFACGYWYHCEILFDSRGRHPADHVTCVRDSSCTTAALRVLVSHRKT